MFNIGEYLKFDTVMAVTTQTIKRVIKHDPVYNQCSSLCGTYQNPKINMEDREDVFIQMNAISNIKHLAYWDRADRAATSASN